MVTCINCDSKNSLDSRFCKSCGKPLDQEAVEKAHAGLEDLVSQGFKALNDERAEEASLIAETALTDDPSSTSALSLKAMCKEKDGQIAEALELYEKVLVLKPDSALDRIKVTHLRNQITGKALAAPAAPDRKTALIGALAATVLVVSVGVALAGFINRDGDKSATNSPNVAEQKNNPAAQLNGANPGQQQTPQNQTPNNSANPGTTADVGTAKQTPSGGGNDNSNFRVPRIGSDVGAMPGANDGPLILDPNKFSITGQQNPDESLNSDRGNRGNDRVATNTNQDQGPDPKVIGNGDQGTFANANTGGNKGVYEIKFSQGNRGNGGGGNANGGGNTVNVQDGQQADVLVRNGLQQYQMGKFGDAAKSFEGALKAGADPGRTNQRLAQCYQRLNQSGEAINAYGRAISAFESQIKSGKSSATAQAGLDSCKAAVQILKGGS